MNYLLFTFQPLLLAAQAQAGEAMRVHLLCSVPLAVIGFCALFTVVIKLVKMASAARACRAALAENSEVEITKTGRLNLSLEVPVLTFLAGRGLRYELFSLPDGRAVDLRPTAALLLGGRKGVSTMTIPVRVFEITETGKYLLKVSGFKPQPDFSRYQLIIERPTSLKTNFYVFGIILTAGMFITGLVFTLIAAGEVKYVFE